MLLLPGSDEVTPHRDEELSVAPGQPLASWAVWSKAVKLP